MRIDELLKLIRELHEEAVQRQRSWLGQRGWHENSYAEGFADGAYDFMTVLHNFLEENPI